MTFLARPDRLTTTWAQLLGSITAIVKLDLANDEQSTKEEVLLPSNMVPQIFLECPFRDTS